DFIALGCENIQVTTAVMQYGYRIIDDMIDGMKRFLSHKGMKSITELVGAAVPNIVQMTDLDSRTIVYPKMDHSKCIGCGRCYLSCYDGGHQAITMDPDNRKPHIDAKKCVGCHLCLLICPAEAINPGKRVKKPRSL
ncbi:MAG: 4Fe-4S binding protein, partial [Veillonella sp.]|nr:4Fe-4S binding protein [Veillonella sp.]